MIGINDIALCLKLYIFDDNFTRFILCGYFSDGPLVASLNFLNR